ncbi:MAG: prepilin peptidase [Deltaproteobacteria bacterium]|nr:prepilin peptidase [Deltaproteobacteria bacterium]
MDVIADFLSTPAAVVCAGLWGAVWGSFFNVVIARVPRSESIVRPASRCMSCQAPIRAWDNIPVLSYIFLRGRCRQCGFRISARYPLVEALTAALAAAIFWQFTATDGGEAVAVRLGRFAVYFTFASALIVLAFIDLDTKRLPDIITLPGTLVLYFAAFAAHDVSWKERLIGAAAGYLFVRLIADFYYYVLKREGLGLGDGKLLAMVGAVLGWKALPVVVFAASVVGSAVSIPVLLATRDRTRGTSLRHVEIPFGPFLALGALIDLFAGPQIMALLLP